MGPEGMYMTISKYVSLTRTHTWAVIANHIKLLFITFANTSTVQRCKSDTAACSRMRDLTGALGNASASCPSPVEISNLSGASAENDPECSSNVENIFSAGVASSTAVSADALARHRFRQTFNAKILALCIGAMSPSCTQSSSTSISSFIKSGDNLEKIKYILTGSLDRRPMSSFLIKNAMIASLLCSNAVGLKRAICTKTVVWATSSSGVASESLSDMDLRAMNRSSRAQTQAPTSMISTQVSS